MRKMPGRRRGKGIFVLVSILGLIFVISFFVGRWGLFEGRGISLSNDKIAVISIEGVLTSSTDVIRQFKQYEENEDVKALVLRIDSPGGTVVAAQEIYEEIGKLLSLLDGCEFSRFAPSSARSDAESLYRDAVQVIKKLEDRL